MFLQGVRKAYDVCRKFFPKTRLETNALLSSRHNARILLKREDTGPVRSYKGRGALNKMSSLKEGSNVVTCSAGNHAQGVAYACINLGMKADIFMPKNTTKQKIDRVVSIGGSHVNIFLEGSTFDDSYEIAIKHCTERGREFIHPFNDQYVIEGQASIAMEIMEQRPHDIDYIIVPVGGGGLAAGVSQYMSEACPTIKVIGVEPLGAASMTLAMRNGAPIELDAINSFVDGASVRRVGELNYKICSEMLDRMLLIDEGHVCSKILQMYNDSGIIIEPAGVLSLCALDLLKEEIKGKSVICVISGGNSDVFRMPEILERSLLYEGRKHYFKIEFAQKAGALREFIMNVLGQTDDIIYFRYTKVINKETGPVLIGIETKTRKDGIEMTNRLNKLGISYEKITNVNDI
jgi:threonine dehydratase